jgi:hypothetical protein
MKIKLFAKNIITKNIYFQLKNDYYLILKSKIVVLAKLITNFTANKIVDKTVLYQLWIDPTVQYTNKESIVL